MRDEDLRRTGGLTPLALIPFARAARTRMGELTVLGGSSSAWEAYRSLHTNLELVSASRLAKTFVVTSAKPRAGKSRTAANLAIVLAATGHHTLLLDADLRRPSLHGFFGRAGTRGFSDVILDERNGREMPISEVPEVPNLWILAAGARPPDPSHVLGSARVKAVLGELASRFDYVVLDTPALGVVSDPALLAAQADATILVTEQGNRGLRSLLTAKAQLDAAGARVLGFVVNKGRAGLGRYSRSAAPSLLMWGRAPEPYRLKRLLDLCVAVPLLIPATPLLALSTVAILVESGRPVLFRPRRLGRDGRMFTVYKLRTMIRDADAQLDVISTKNVAEGMVKIADDPRVTRVGRWLRRFSLDELPQLWNVVRGEMSMVGPRPHDAAELIISAPEHMERLAVKPGLTGLWQIRARSDPSLASRIYWDLRYVASCSLSLDLRILWETVPAVLGGQGGRVDESGSHGPPPLDWGADLASRKPLRRGWPG